MNHPWCEACHVARQAGQHGCAEHGDASNAWAYLWCGLILAGIIVFVVALLY